MIVPTQLLSDLNLVDEKDAIAHLAKAERMLVIGNAGTGKSTLAQALARSLDLRYLSMDRDFFWRPGWRLRPRPEIGRLIADAAAEPRWIMDGNSPGSLPVRLARADLIIFRCPPRRVALSGVLRRWWRYRGRSRPEMADGCTEKIDLEFLRYIWNFDAVEVPEILAMIAAHRPDIPVIPLKSYAEGDNLLVLLGQRH
ncbi:AAA family ATPase [Ensifer soli]|uniref:AAA family ATPase n=1 Tax=Ciceribacter sp. sgz301302 TaxID=3342379 RepID=UPI0035B9F7BA